MWKNHCFQSTAIGGVAPASQNMFTANGVFADCAMIRSVSEYANWRVICGLSVLGVGFVQTSWLSGFVVFVCMRVGSDRSIF